MNATIFGTHQQNTLDQFHEIASRAAKAALMADGHLGYIMPVGGVAAYWNSVSVAGVGVDIGCGNCAVQTDLYVNDLNGNQLEKIADDIARTISFGVGRNNLADDAPTDHDLFDSPDWTRLRERAGIDMEQGLKQKARNQLGTVGSGNHYVDVFADQNGAIWVGVHFGSRGLGHGIATGFNALGSGSIWGDNKIKDQEVLLDMDSSLGKDYWALMILAGRYAYVGREWVTQKVVEILGANVVDMVHNHHNFAWKEPHVIDGKTHEVYVVRKGATPAVPGQRGFVGGSMGDISVILKGTDANEYPKEQEIITNLQESAMYSTIHGSGRVMSRSEAKGKINRKTGELQLNEDGTPKRPPKITKDMQNEWLQRERVILRGGGVDEAPQVYRRLPDVLQAQGNTITVTHTLKPLVVVMAGANEFDPYKD